MGIFDCEIGSGIRLIETNCQILDYSESSPSTDIIDRGKNYWVLLWIEAVYEKKFLGYIYKDFI